jgi:hypothetical protein
MKFNSLNQIVDDVLLTIRNNNIAESENISRRQVEQWVHTYRTYLIKQDVDKDGDIDPQYIQEINDISLTPDAGFLRADIELPKLIDLNHRLGLISVRDSQGNPIQIGTKNKAKFQTYRKYGCSDYIATLTGRNLRVYGPGIIRYVNIEILPEDPTEIDSCNDGDSLYPIPGDKLPALKELIFAKEFGILLRMRSDDTNNTANELSNGASKTKQVS